ncbi:MAG TPA: TonB-dependent receptor, partial [Paludibacter sp.]|nr:TonB-dependent receptor [Paludibacter sp.]
MKKHNSLMKRALFLVVAISLHGIMLAQTRTITGVVKETTGDAIIGVSVTVKGATVGTVTNVEGAYSITIPSTAKTLVFSYVGMQKQELPITGSVMNVTMQDQSKTLDELVVIGYGTVRKSDLTGSVSVIKSKDILSVSTNNALESLQGRVSGIDITKSSGQAGAGLSFTIRGARSLTASNSPLILVDGIPYGSNIDINPSDIESMEVLKDASSTAIYGSKGANGVIIITTKRGKAGKTKISFNTYAAINSLAKAPRYMDGNEYAQLKREANRTTGKWASTADDSKIFSPVELDYLNSGQMADFENLLLHDGLTQNYELSMSGGNEKTVYSLSFGFMKEKGIFKVNDEYNRLNGRVTIDHSVTKNFKVGTNILYTYKDQDTRRDPLNSAHKVVPIAKAYNDDGSVNTYPAPGYSTQLNPLLDNVDGATTDNILNKRFFGSAYMDWAITKDLKFKSNIGIDFSDKREGYFYAKMTLDGAGTASGSGAYITSNSNLTWENVLNYNKTLGDHSFQIMVGNSVGNNNYEYYSATGKGQLSPYTLYHSLETNTTEVKIGSDYTKVNTVSVFGRLNYKYKEKYLLTASLRDDASSVLAENHKSAIYPSVALGWRVNEESFMKPLTDISNLKLRLSWGKSGSSAIDPYQTLGGLGNSQYSFNNVQALGYYEKLFSNTSLGWENTAVYDIGLDFSLFNNRISFTIDGYKSFTSDLLLSRTIPMTSGYNSVTQNVGKTENLGLDITMNTLNIKTKNFQWSTDVNFSTSKEKITQLASGATEDTGNSWFVGSPISVIYDYKKIGIWQTSEATEAAKYGSKPGEIKVEDVNQNGTIDVGDRVKFNRRPAFTLGMNNNFTYKNFDLSIFAYARIGQYMSYTYNTSYKSQGLENGAAVDYWTPENPSNDFPRPDAGVTQASRLYYTTLGIVKGSFIKIKNVSLGYTFPKTIISKLGINTLKVYVTGQNLFTFSNLKDY